MNAHCNEECKSISRLPVATVGCFVVFQRVELARILRRSIHASGRDPQKVVGVEIVNLVEEGMEAGEKS